MPPPVQNSSTECSPASAHDGRQFWRSLEELAGDGRFAASLAREFPEYADQLSDEPTRRKFLQVMGASLALAGLQGCVQQPAEEIVPYVRAPEQLIPGRALYYATALMHDGCGEGLLVASQMGRPVKVEGNPLHPAVPEIMRAANARSTNLAAGESPLRFGPTDVIAQASVLSLYDPDRSQTVLQNGQIDTWESFVSDLFMRLEKFRIEGGRGLRLLTETVISPTLADQLRQLFEKYPNAMWHQYESLSPDPAIRGSQLAYGRAIQPIYRIEQADVIFSIDADFLVDGPFRLQNASAFARRRQVSSKAAADVSGMNRLYVVETGRTLTGAVADHRLPLGPAAILRFALRLAKSLGAIIGNELLNTGSEIAEAQAWFDAVRSDLQAARGRSLVIPGRGQPAVVHALTHWMNNTLGNAGRTVEYYEPIAARSEDQVVSLRMLTQAMRAREVESLLIVGGNPVFDAPADLDFAGALKQVPHTVHMSQYDDETSARCTWHLPQAHALESWSDVRAANGTATIVQPLIAPLFRSKTVHELLGILLGNPQPNGHEIVRGVWRVQHEQRESTEVFDAVWQTALHDGIVAGTTSSPLAATLRTDFTAVINEEISNLEQTGGDSAFQVIFRPAPSVWDGRFANNGWLQELPQPFTTLTWDNAALIAPQTAASHHLATGDVVEVAVGAAQIEIPVCIMPGHPADTMTLHVGYGRTSAGRVGDAVGADVYPLRSSDAMWFAAALIRKTGRSQVLATTQEHHLMEGRHLVRAGTATEFEANPDHPAFMTVGHHNPPADATMYPPHPYEGYKWGMVVDLSKCIGCSACVVACQAENNVPIVGKDQVSRGREMHWLRIDQYYSGDTDNPDSYHQPVMCQHCELAPCEVVCPVAATTHSDEGLNEMVYNRCVGTRYCSNNCPYKVRRFNFLDYNAELRSDALVQLRSNPEVTVRSRGVMEKCTYCVQRISAARIDAEKEDRTIRDGEIVTACQAACPAEAITFGNLNDPNAAVTLAAQSSLNYSLLGELNTRPRTNYLAVVRNPHPKLVHATSDQHVD